MDVSEQDWFSYWNGMWVAIMAMTTVGYGDFYPVTYMGRMVVTIASLWGAFLTSMFVVALSNLIAFDKKEERVIKFCRQLDRYDR